MSRFQNLTNAEVAAAADRHEGRVSVAVAPYPRDAVLMRRLARRSDA